MDKPGASPASPHQKKGPASLAPSEVQKILGTQSPLIYSPHLAYEIETALIGESAEMLLLTLKRLDESILLAPHMISAWKRLVDRLASLNTEFALKYIAEMSLYWDPYYADAMMADAEGLGQASQQNHGQVIGFIQGTQAIGNELDAYGTEIWARLMLAKVSNEPIDHLLNSILHIFPASILGTGYCRTPFGVDFSNMQTGINPDFRKCAAETYLSILWEFIPKHPEEGIFFITCVMNTLIGEDYPSIMEKFFEHWKTCIQYIAQKDEKEAISYVDSDTDFPMFGSQKEQLKSELFGNASSIAEKSIPFQLPQKAFEAARDWCEAVMCQPADISKKEKIWEAVIIQLAERSPEFAIEEIYSSIGPFRSQIIEKIGEKALFEKMAEITLKIVDTLAKAEILRALRLCVYTLREERYAFFYFSLEELSMRILEYIDKIGESYPDVVLEGYTLIDKGIECSMHWGVPGVNYLSEIDERHRKIFDFIPQAAGINLLISISACERLLLRTDKNSEIYAQVLILWREYMGQLKQRNAVIAAEYYAQMCGTIKNKSDELFVECEKGYQVDCLEYIQKQRRTVIPLEQSSQTIKTIGNPET